MRSFYIESHTLRVTCTQFSEVRSNPPPDPMTAGLFQKLSRFGSGYIGSSSRFDGSGFGGSEAAAQMPEFAPQRNVVEFLETGRFHLMLAFTTDPNEIRVGNPEMRLPRLF